MFQRWRTTQSLLVALTLVVAVNGILPVTAHGGARQNDSLVQITYTYPGAIQKDLPLVNDAINAITQKKIGVTVKLNTIDWGAYDQKMKLAFAAGQPCDLVFTASWTNNYYQLVNNGDLLALDDLLKTYAPQYWASMSPATWNAARVQGKIYGAINQQMFAARWGIEVRKDLAQKYHLDLSQIHGYADLEPFLATIKAKEPGITPLLSDDGYQGSIFYPNMVDGLLDVGGQQTGEAAIYANDKSLKVFDPWELPSFKTTAELVYKWHKLGYYTKDPLPRDQAQAAFKAGRYAVVLDQAREGEFGKLEANWGWDFVIKPFVRPLLTTGSIVATMNSICRTSTHPEAAMKFLELLNTDKQVYNLITRGIEGKHYVVVDRAKGLIALPKGLTAATDPYLPNTDWMFGNQFNAYYANPAEIGSWDLQRKINQSSYPSVALGFSVVTDPIKTQLAQVSAVEKQYGNAISKGLVDPDTTIPIFYQALKAAGEDQILAEVQRQINAWAKTKGAH